MGPGGGSKRAKITGVTSESIDLVKKEVKFEVTDRYVPSKPQKIVHL